VGVALPLGTLAVEARLRAEVVLNTLRVTIVQPGTTRDDAGDRTLVGGRGSAELVIPLAGSLGVFAGASVDSFGGKTTVRVQGRPSETVEAWSPSMALGLNARLP
jgi:hypothetical protein